MAVFLSQLLWLVSLATLLFPHHLGGLLVSFLSFFLSCLFVCLSLLVFLSLSLACSFVFRCLSFSFSFSLFFFFLIVGSSPVLGFVGALGVGEAYVVERAGTSTRGRVAHLRYILGALYVAVGRRTHS